MNEELIDRNTDVLGGTPVFAGTRVPVRILMEHLEAGDSLDDLLDDYPTVKREQAVALLERLKAQAKANERSLEGEVRHVLTRELTSYLGTVEFLARADSQAASTTGTKQTDSTELVREDRNR